MPKRAGQRADDFHAEFSPEFHRRFVGGDDKVELQCPKPQPARFAQTMLAHAASDPLPPRIRSNDEPGVCHVRAAAGLILVQCVTADDMSILAGCCRGRRCRPGEPNGFPYRSGDFLRDVNMRLPLKPVCQPFFTRNVWIERIRVARCDHIAENFPDCVVISTCGRSNVGCHSYSRAIGPSLCEIIRSASAMISRTICPAGLISFTRPTPWPARRSIDSKSPVASTFGGKPMNRSSGISCPAIFVLPITGSSGRDSCPRASFPSHSCTKLVRSVRCGALGQPKPKRIVRTVSPSFACKSLRL